MQGAQKTILISSPFISLIADEEDNALMPTSKILQTHQTHFVTYMFVFCLSAKTAIQGHSLSLTSLMIALSDEYLTQCFI